MPRSAWSRFASGSVIKGLALALGSDVDSRCKWSCCRSEEDEELDARYEDEEEEDEGWGEEEPEE
jgi:hypothetical protein